MQRLLCPLLFGEVAHERSEQPAIAQPDGSDRQLDRKLTSVPVQGGDLDALPQDRPFPRLEEPCEPARVPLPVLRWNDRRGEAATDRLRRGPAEHGFGGPAPARDPSGLVHGNACVQRAVEQRLEACLGGAHGFLRPLSLDGHRHLGGNELEDVLLALPEPDPLGIGLRHEHADGPVVGLQRYADPVQRRRADQLGFSSTPQVLVHLRGREQGLSRAQHVFGEAPLEPVGCRRRVVLVHPVGKTEEPRLRVVQRDVQVPCGHELADDAVDRPEQLGQVLGGVGGLRDPVGGRLQLRRLHALGDFGLGAAARGRSPATRGHLGRSRVTSGAEGPISVIIYMKRAPSRKGPRLNVGHAAKIPPPLRSKPLAAPPPLDIVVPP